MSLRTFLASVEVAEVRVEESVMMHECMVRHCEFWLEGFECAPFTVAEFPANRRRCFTCSSHGVLLRYNLIGETGAAGLSMVCAYPSGLRKSNDEPCPCART